MAAWGLCKLTPPPSAVTEAGVVLNLPEHVLDFTSTTEAPSPAEKTILPPDTGIAKRIYKNSSPDSISCQIVLSGTDRRSIHRPEACLRGQGWTINNGGTVPVTLSDGTKMEVMKLVIDRPVTDGEGKKRILRSLYLYWFASKHVLTPLHRERIARTYIDLLFYNRAHRWAYIIVSAPVLQGFAPGGKDESETLDMLKHFISEAAPQFQRVEKSDSISSSGSKSL